MTGEARTAGFLTDQPSPVGAEPRSTHRPGPRRRPRLDRGEHRHTIKAGGTPPPDRRNDFCVLMIERLNPRGGEPTPHYPSKINNPVYTADLTTSAMLRNPAYAGRACFGKTMRTDQIAGLNRTARLSGRATQRHYTVIERPREDWIEICVPALVAEDTWERVQRRVADNKRYASRNSTNPSLLQGICACASCGYAYYRTSTRTTNKIIYYYRCLGSDNYRYEHGRVCANKPVRADYLDALVWDHLALCSPTRH